MLHQITCMLFRETYNSLYWTWTLHCPGHGLYTVLDMDFTLTPPIYSCTLLHVTRWCSLLARTTPTPSLHAPEKSSIRPEHDQYLTVRAHPFRGAHVHPRGSAIRHQFSIHVHLATSAVDLTPRRHYKPVITHHPTAVHHDKHLPCPRQRCLNLKGQAPPKPPPAHLLLTRQPQITEVKHKRSLFNVATGKDSLAFTRSLLRQPQRLSHFSLFRVERIKAGPYFTLCFSVSMARNVCSYIPVVVYRISWSRPCTTVPHAHACVFEHTSIHNMHMLNTCCRDANMRFLA
jgi:hypothetical protein